MVVQVARAAEGAHEQQLGRRVRVQAAGDQEVGQRQAVGGFGPSGGKGGEGGRGYGGPDVRVEDASEEDVEGRGGYLEDVS